MDVPAGHPEKPAGTDGFVLLNRMNGGVHEELAFWGLSFLDIEDDANILDIGCGGGANLARLLERATHGHATGVDYSPVSVQASSEFNEEAIAQDRCTVMEGNASDLPLPSDSFDVATAFETTYYWDLPTAFREVKRVLKPGGFFLVCNEDDGADPEIVDLSTRIPGMVVHTPAMLEDELVDAGFEIVASEHAEQEYYLAIVAQKPE